MTITQDTSDAPLIFISYTAADKERVLPYYDTLLAKGYAVWMDARKLLGGQDWDFEIKKAFNKSTIILVFLSNNLNSKRGYIQREIKLALDNLTEKLKDDIYIIPIRLDQSGVMEELKGIQYIDAVNSFPIDDIESSLKHQIDKIGGNRLAVQEASSVNWFVSKFKEEWEGLPGYEVELTFINLNSNKFANLIDISDIIKGELKKSLLLYRSNKMIQSSEHFSYIEEKHTRTNTYEATCLEPVITGRVISILYLIYFYDAGAAHPNHHFEPYNFIMEPLVIIKHLGMLFKDESQALAAVQKWTRIGVVGSLSERGGEISVDDPWLISGTQNWDSFSIFTFSNEGLMIHFALYTIGPYAIGSHSVLVKYDEIIEFMNPEYIKALGIQHILFRKNYPLDESTL